MIKVLTIACIIVASIGAITGLVGIIKCWIDYRETQTHRIVSKREEK